MPLDDRFPGRDLSVNDHSSAAEVPRIWGQAPGAGKMWKTRSSWQTASLAGLYYLLPCDAFIKINKKQGIELNPDNLPKEPDKLYESVEFTSSQYGPIKNPELGYEPPSLEEALKIIHRRFGPLRQAVPRTARTPVRWAAFGSSAIVVLKNQM